MVESRHRVANQGLYGLLRSLYYAAIGAYLWFTSIRPIGTNIYEREWDVLILLDACRVDALKAVADEYEFVGDVEVITSVGSNSPEWMVNTFNDRYAADVNETAYVTSNPLTKHVLEERMVLPRANAVPIGSTHPDRVPPEAFGHLDRVYEYASDPEVGVVPPRAVTDRAITAGREGNEDRLIVHYMQPHAPYIGETKMEKGMVRLRNGEMSHDEAWNAYLDNLRAVLDEVERLLGNLDANRVVITADHGEAFGQLSFYGHPIGCPLPSVRRVPWVETTAEDTGACTPETMANEERVDLDDQLEALGYM